MDREQALSKINKLMNLANCDGAQGNEVDNALRQAQALMRKFAIDMAEAMQAGKKPQFNWAEEDVAFDPDKKVKSVPLWYQWMAVQVAKFTDTIVVLKRIDGNAGITFRGNDEDTIFAGWLIVSLKEQLRRATRDAKCGSPENRETFRKAFATGVSNKLRDLRKARDEELKKHSNALIVVDMKLVERDKYFGGERYGKPSKTRAKFDDSWNKGYTAGKNAKVDRPITTAGASKALN